METRARLTDAAIRPAARIRTLVLQVRCVTTMHAAPPILVRAREKNAGRVATVAAGHTVVRVTEVKFVKAALVRHQQPPPPLQPQLALATRGKTQDARLAA